MRSQDYISVNPLVVHGQARIHGTRIPVAVVLANLADGLSADDIIRSYPSLTREGIQAALAYAADLAQSRVGFCSRSISISRTSVRILRASRSGSSCCERPSRVVRQFSTCCSGRFRCWRPNGPKTGCGSWSQVAFAFAAPGHRLSNTRCTRRSLVNPVRPPMNAGR